MSKDMKAGLGWWGLGVLIVIFAALAGCTQAVYEAPIMTGQVAPPMLGVTVCSENNLPIIIIKEELPPSPMREVVIFHERVHVEQVKAYRGCKEFLRAYSNSKTFRLNKELEAYCKSLDFAVELGANRELAWKEIEGVMKVHFDTTGVSCRGHYEHRADGVGDMPQRQVSRGASVSEVRHPP